MHKRLQYLLEHLLGALGLFHPAPELTLEISEAELMHDLEYGRD